MGGNKLQSNSLDISHPKESTINILAAGAFVNPEGINKSTVGGTEDDIVVINCRLLP